MIYFRSSRLLIRDLTDTDAAIITAEEIAQGWHQTQEKYLARLKDRDRGRCVSFAAEYDGRVAGYVNVYFRSVCGPFAERGLPEIVDLGVLEKYRRLGIGSALMDQAEKTAAEYADTVTLRVGLHAGYGSAQRMYVKRGYLPDGSGVWYHDRPCTPYAEYPNDDALGIYLFKIL